MINPERFAGRIRIGRRLGLLERDLDLTLGLALGLVLSGCPGLLERLLPRGRLFGLGLDGVTARRPPSLGRRRTDSDSTSSSSIVNASISKAVSHSDSLSGSNQSLSEYKVFIGALHKIFTSVRQNSIRSGQGDLQLKDAMAGVQHKTHRNKATATNMSQHSMYIPLQ
jgi:hypothetical protein